MPTVGIEQMQSSLGVVRVGISCDILDAIDCKAGEIKGLEMPHIPARRHLAQMRRYLNPAGGCQPDGSKKWRDEEVRNTPRSSSCHIFKAIGAKESYPVSLQECIFNLYTRFRGQL